VGYMFTSESVTSGHPDKLCDFISDSILDECIKIDPFARVAIEVLVKGMDSKIGAISSIIIIAGEVSINSNASINYEKIARRCCIDIGYCDAKLGMDASDLDSCEVKIYISEQSNEISQGVSSGKGKYLDQGAGDQGIMYGYATNESEKFEGLKDSYMPLPILLAQRLTSEITNSRKSGELGWAGPDGKSQVTIEYNEEGIPQYVDTIIIAVQHFDMVGNKFKDEEEEHQFIQKEIKEKIIKKVIPRELYSENLKLIVNGTGKFCKGGPHADAGLTGRKIIVDTYGGRGRHGGGAFSGKDPTKVDRSAAYAARNVAKYIVASGFARECEIQLSYSIGISEPISINLNVDTFGSSIISEEDIKKLVEDIFDFRPASIINRLNLRKPIYAVTSSGGHFGRISKDDYFTWEKLDNNILRKLGEK